MQRAPQLPRPIVPAVQHRVGQQHTPDSRHRIEGDAGPGEAGVPGPGQRPVVGHEVVGVAAQRPSQPAPAVEPFGLAAQRLGAGGRRQDRAVLGEPSGAQVPSPGPRRSRTARPGRRRLRGSRRSRRARHRISGPAGLDRRTSWLRSRRRCRTAGSRSPPSPAARRPVRRRPRRSGLPITSATIRPSMMKPRSEYFTTVPTGASSGSARTAANRSSAVPGRRHTSRVAGSPELWVRQWRMVTSFLRLGIPGEVRQVLHHRIVQSDLPRLGQPQHTRQRGGHLRQRGEVVERVRADALAERRDVDRTVGPASVGQHRARDHALVHRAGDDLPRIW